MAKFTEVSVSYSKTVQVKQYEPVKLTLSATATLEPDDSRKETTRKMYRVLKKQLHELMLEDLKDHGLA